MKKMSFVPFFVLTVFIVTVGKLNAQPYSSITVEDQHSKQAFSVKKEYPSSGSKDILYQQIGNPSSEDGINSQEYPDFPPNNCQVADDFTVPEGEDWMIETIFIQGNLVGPGPVDLINISIYADMGGMPGPEIYFMPGMPVPPDPLGNFDIFLPGAPVLVSGNYWLSVQAMMPTFFGEWFWQKQEFPTIGSELHWQNPNGGLGGPPFWEPGSVIWGGLGLEDWNLSFTLMGTRIILNPPPVINTFYPPGCFPGRFISLYGHDFGTFLPTSTIFIDGLPFHEDTWRWNSDTIVFEMPFMAAGDSISISIMSDFGCISNVIRLGFHYPEEAYFSYPYENEIIYSDSLAISVYPETFMDFIRFADFYYRSLGETTWNYLGT
ncbi:MAG: IPT/TIG domain-containing protein, partial [Bacteroidales bacterium]